jgi:DNA-binding FadR family transcriptional regulator
MKAQASGSAYRQGYSCFSCHLGLRRRSGKKLQIAVHRSEALTQKSLSQVFENLRTNLTWVVMLSFQLGVPKRREGIMHRAIVEALAAYDEEAALNVTNEHLGSMPRVVAALTGVRTSE